MVHSWRPALQEAIDLFDAAITTKRLRGVEIVISLPAGSTRSQTGDLADATDTADANAGDAATAATAATAAAATSSAAASSTTASSASSPPCPHSLRGLLALILGSRNLVTSAPAMTNC